MNLWKVLQRQIYDILLHKRCVSVFAIVITILIVLFHLNEFLVKRSSLGQLPFDNISGKSFKNGESDGIDAVITWVNGSDPLFRAELLQHLRQARREVSLSCPYTACFPSHFTASQGSHSQFEDLGAILVNSSDFQSWSLVAWDNVVQATTMSQLPRTRVDMTQAHWTSDANAPNVYLKNDSVFVELEGEGWLSEAKLQKWLGQGVKHVWTYNRTAVVEFTSSRESHLILQGAAWRMMRVNQGVKLNITRAHLILSLPTSFSPSDYSLSRFDDKEELRYCLRSMEKHAGWVRQVYIVTNGQIPHWLDLEHPRITIIPHQALMPSHHLPTFSSPAIEAHIHRIPGLSSKFLYLNDDILLGQDIFPEDFISPAYGQKVYLTWAVPDCVPLCPWSWVKDGSCDAPCNVTQCDYDGGDCLPNAQSEGGLYSYDSPDHTYDYDLNIKPYQILVREETDAVGIKLNTSAEDVNGALKPQTRLKLRRWGRALEGRRELDTFAESLLYVNGLFNREYGFKIRKVPAHMPHLIDTTVLQGLHYKFEEEFEKTSSHKFRSPEDMQFAFSYFYYLMSESVEVTPEEIFDKYDTDGSGTWSDREIRTVLTQVYSLPLSRASVLEFEARLKSCARLEPDGATQPPYERYLDSKLPLIRREDIAKCDKVIRPLIERWGRRPRFPYQVVKTPLTSAHTAFHMLTVNLTTLLNSLDTIRSNPKKFICLNDNMEGGGTEEYQTARAVLLDFYHSLFPNASQFELDPDFRNRFLYLWELEAWQRRTSVLATAFSFVIITLLVVTTLTCFKPELTVLLRLDTKKNRKQQRS